MSSRWSEGKKKKKNLEIIEKKKSNEPRDVLRRINDVRGETRTAPRHGIGPPPAAAPADGLVTPHARMKVNARRSPFGTVSTDRVPSARRRHSCNGHANGTRTRTPRDDTRTTTDEHERTRRGNRFREARHHDPGEYVPVAFRALFRRVLLRSSVRSNTKPTAASVPEFRVFEQRDVSAHVTRTRQRRVRQYGRGKPCKKSLPTFPSGFSTLNRSISRPLRRRRRNDRAPCEPRALRNSIFRWPIERTAFHRRFWFQNYSVGNGMFSGGSEARRTCRANLCSLARSYSLCFSSVSP